MFLLSSLLVGLHNADKWTCGLVYWLGNRGYGFYTPHRCQVNVTDDGSFEHVVKPYPRTFKSIAESCLAGSEYLHVAPPYSPDDILVLLDDMDEYNARCGQRPEADNHNVNCGITKSKGKDPWRPKIVYEPTPPACHPLQRGALERACKRLEVLS